MRPFRSSTINSLALTLLFLLIIILMATDSHVSLRSNPSWVVGFPSRNQEYNINNYYYVGHPQRQRRHSLLDTCRPSSRSRLCDHLEMIHHHQRPFSPPPMSPQTNKDREYDIDPRYGVEKRLVPSGPNPLHN